MPADGADLAVLLRRVRGVTVLEGEAVGVVNESVAIRDIVFEETIAKSLVFLISRVTKDGDVLPPEQVPSDNRLWL